MTATTQDVLAFKTQPEFEPFASLPDSYIFAIIGAADVFLDASMWDPPDYAAARFYLAAHLMTLAQQSRASMVIGSTVGIGGSIDTFISSIRFGERTVSVGQRQLLSMLSQNQGLGPGESMLPLTLWGQLFLQLRARNIMPIMVI